MPLRLISCRFIAQRISGVASLLLVAGVLTAPAVAQTFTVLHHFSGLSNDGSIPYAGVAVDNAGNLYGTTWLGGTHGAGVIYQLKRAGSAYTENILYTFTLNTDGGQPKSGVTFGPGGTLYGATNAGGYFGCGAHGFTGCGVVFSARPPGTFCRSVLCPWTETALYAFQGITSGDGNNPLYGEVAFDRDGNIYGTTPNDGTFGGGTVYKLTRSGNSWTETILHQFGASGDGSRPEHSVILDSAGNIYGTTHDGGANNAGVIFQLVPSGSGWTENILLNFNIPSDVGGAPEAGLIMDTAGNFYGATSINGLNNGNGAVFELSPSAGGWQVTSLHQFTARNSEGPIGNLVMDRQGNLYGVTYLDGAGGNGMLFKLTNTGSSWSFSDLHDFGYNDDGGEPTGDLSIDADGNIYGTATSGGHGNSGTVWKYTP